MGVIMSLMTPLKKRIIKKSLNKKNKENPFNQTYSENYQIVLDGNKDSINSHYFSAHNQNGESLFVRRAERGDGSIELWCCYHNQDTTYVNTVQHFSNGDKNSKVELIEEAKQWKFSFSGEVCKMIKDENGIGQYSDEKSLMSVDAVFNATTNIFDFTYHLDPSLMAAAVAKEKWSNEFFQALQSMNQIHYEQQGIVTANISIDNQKIEFESIAMRDHSYGTRDWAYMDRHIWLMVLIDDKTSVNTNMVKYPHLEHLKTGYYENKGELMQLKKITDMQEIQTDGHVPGVFNYQVVLKNKEVFNITVEKEIEIPFEYDGYIVYEGIAKFTINNKIARGISEFGFNKNQERWLFK